MAIRRILVGLALCAGPVFTQNWGPEDDLLSALRWRHVGPVGNRVVAVSGVAGDSLTFYAGAASGGVFKTTDGGIHWRPVFDDTPAFAIGALSVAPSDPNVVWVGTGETFIRSNVALGDGVYRSTDAGESWTRVGLERTGRIGRIVVHPGDPDTAWVAALGNLYTPHEERGVFRTRDGGASWERVLFVDEHTGAIDLVLDPTNPRILYAATWQMEIRTWGRWSGGPGSGLFKSTDGGDSWSRLQGNGLPRGPWGKIGLALSADDPDRLWALIETNSNPDYCTTGRLSESSPEPCPEGPESVPIEFQGVLWRSENAGESWRMINPDNTLAQRPLYYTRMAAAPDNANELVFVAVQQSISHDGGVSIEEQNSGWDHHDVWIDPVDPDRRIVGHDGGVSITHNRGESWHRPQLPAAQMYHVAVDDRVPYWLYGNRQDGPSFRGPSRTLTGESEIPIGAWHSVGGCEVGFALPVPGSDRVWSGCYDGLLDLHDLGTGHSRDVSVWPMAIESWPAEELEYRIQWTAPLALSPHDPERVYYGSQYVHASEDGGQSWQILSPDLTTDDPQLQRRWGGLTLDDAGPTLAPTLFALAESPLEQGALWAGTNDGKLWLSRDGGEAWSDLTANLVGLPSLGTVRNIEPSRHRAGRAYVAVDRHQLGDNEPYLYRTDDWGESWRRIDGDLPRGVYGYAHCIREDPAREGLLYVGTESSVWVSFDDGERWHSLRSDLPPVPVHWLTVQERFADLVIATYGRGFWILDDITPLRELAERPLEEPGALLRPRPAWRFRPREAAVSHPDVPAAGRNPDYGATLHYWLPPSEETDNGEQRAVALQIRRADGEPVRRLDDQPATGGLHRVTWDLRGERTPEVKLRTRPKDNPLIGLGDEGWRPLRDGGRLSLLEPPGRYTVALEIDGVEVASTDLEVLGDPSSEAGGQGIERQMAVLRPLHAGVASVAEMINDLETLRARLAELRTRVAESVGDSASEQLLEAIEEVAGSAEALEGRFFDLRLTGARQDSLRWKRLLYSRLTSLAWAIGRTDFPPTDAQLEVWRLLEAELRDAEERFERLRDESLPALDHQLREAGVGLVALAPPVETGG